jgi:hypothetical protein
MMYGFDTMSLSLCLSMPAFQWVLIPQSPEFNWLHDLMEHLLPGTISDKSHHLAKLFPHIGSLCGMPWGRSLAWSGLGALVRSQMPSVAAYVSSWLV